MSSASWQWLHHEDVIITKESVSGQSDGRKMKGPGDGLAGELIAVGRKNKMLAEPDAGTRQDLSLEKIPEDGRDVRWLAVLVHCADFASEQKLEARRERVDVWCGNHGHAAWCEEAPDIAQETDGAFDMLDDFDGGDKIERIMAELRGKLGVIEIETHVRHRGGETIGVAVYREHIAAERLETRGHGSGSGAKIGSAHAGARVTPEDTLANKIVEAAVRRGVDHQAFA
jgi:hypothetical protein